MNIKKVTLQCKRNLRMPRGDVRQRHYVLCKSFVVKMAYSTVYFSEFVHPVCGNYALGLYLDGERISTRESETRRATRALNTSFRLLWAEYFRLNKLNAKCKKIDWTEIIKLYFITESQIAQIFVVLSNLLRAVFKILSQIESTAAPI